MKASLRSILDILGTPDTRFVIPVFQRVYSWSRRQCDQLWDDMLAAQDAGRQHFMGTFIYMPEDGASEGGARIADLIDGQQRMTTITLMLTALRNTLRDKGDDSAARELEAKYLTAGGAGEADGVAATGKPNASAADAAGEADDSAGTTGGTLCKLQLSEADAPTLANLVFGAALPEGMEPSKNLVDNLKTFQEKITSPAFDEQAFMTGLSCLTVVSVKLEASDSPQQVFESLNSKGRPLSTTDLLRNTLLIKYGSAEQERLFDTYWAPIDDAFQQFGAEQDIYLDAALHSWIAKVAPGVHAAKRNDLYQAFKDYLVHQMNMPLEDMLKSINEQCLKFAADPHSSEAKIHLDWVIDKPQGLISKRKMFGD